MTWQALCATGLIVVGAGSASVRAQAPASPVVAAGSIAVEPAPPRMPVAGSFSYTLLPDSSDNIDTAIDETVGPMSFIIRPIARGRLRRTNPTPQRVHIDVWQDSLGVAFDDGNPVITPLDGQPVPWVNSLTHETYQAHVVLIADTLRQTIAAPDGTRENAYLFVSGGERLHLRVTVTSHRLPKPLVYMLIFRRTGAA
jgi:hypothetical protein